MSLNELLLPGNKPWSNLIINSLQTNEINTQTLSIKNLSSLLVPSPNVGTQVIFGNSDTNNNLTSKDSSGNLSSLSSALSNYIVGDSMKYITIQAAIDDAFSQAPQVVYIKAGQYNESITLKAGVSLCGVGNGQNIETSLVTINGEVLANYVGEVSLTNISFSSNGTNCIISSGNMATNLIIENCTFNNQTSGDCIQINNNQITLLCTNCLFNSVSASGYFFNGISTSMSCTLLRCIIGALTGSGSSNGRIKMDSGIIAMAYCVSNAINHINSSGFMIALYNFFVIGDNPTFVLENGSTMIATNNTILDNATSGTDFITTTTSGTLIKSLFTLTGRTTVAAGILVSSLTVF